MGAKHHFVPQLYLRLFSTNGKQIDVYHLERQAVFRQASLRDQCYRRHLYGRTPEMEGRLAALEGRVGPVLHHAAGKLVLPIAADEVAALLLFLAVQLTRTLGAATDARNLLAMLDDHVPGLGPALSPDQRAAMARFIENPFRFLLDRAPNLVSHLEDLDRVLLRAPSGHAFLTSDNPVVRANEYLSGLRDQGILGLGQQGFQLFLPLTPELTLCLYDGPIYTPRGTLVRGVLDVTPEDVLALNLLQAVYADDHLYARHADPEALKRLRRQAFSDRRARHTLLTTLTDVASLERQDDMYRVTRPTPHLPVRPQCLRVRKSMERVPLGDRWTLRRDVAREALTPGIPGRRFAIARQERRPRRP